MKVLHNLYLSNRFFSLLCFNVVIFITGYFFPLFTTLGKVITLTIIGLLVLEVVYLFRIKNGLFGSRELEDRFSNGDDNLVKVRISSKYTLPMRVRVIDELPIQFQIRNFNRYLKISPGKTTGFDYLLKPVKRGEYHFGYVNGFAFSPLGLATRRFRIAEEKMVKVYPSFLQVRKYELLAIHNRLHELGIKKIRKIGHNIEFEQVREYVAGDDIRTINWKATARHNNYMVNQYQDEKSQQVYCLIDKGRVMQMPFEGMTLLDYAINSSLIFSNVAIKKDDKAGYITFSNKIGNLVAASKKKNQMQNILHGLYNEKTAFKESDFEKLYIFVKRSLNQRSLLILFTNFESLSSLKRQLKYLKRLASDHLLVVVFFENTEMKEFSENPANDLEKIYIKTIAEKFIFEKKVIAKELTRNGIHPVLTSPSNLSVNVINKYLELKSRNLI